MGVICDFGVYIIDDVFDSMALLEAGGDLSAILSSFMVYIYVHYSSFSHRKLLADHVEMPSFDFEIRSCLQH